ncbi:hypothetical protein QYF36_004797 [Acer negundo]|nr:hypothetical protein QYF36_004797 [Acer negundo]
MALRFPRFSQGLAQDPTTRRIWFGIATAHDFESHDDITEERLYQNIFASHFGQLAIIFLWTSGNLFHVAWQGNFEAWVQDPLHVRPIAHAIWDLGQPAVEAFSRGDGPFSVLFFLEGRSKALINDIATRLFQDLTFQGFPFCKAYRARFSSSMSKLWWISTRKNSHFKEHSKRPPVLLDPVPAHHCALGKGTPVSEALDREFPSTGV